ncbi:MAG: hypothetical protein A3B68_08640 [Candidatus Melainabacteria bacterium RIFCSPHIGHO2_02_FULL_34_12]|nr:MAG: hypothetical protein A3B68_08640 [Candidatus Melainabacteria bacterium RIFCSPHIGHO2_02_FULL_34_12]
MQTANLPPNEDALYKEPVTLLNSGKTLKRLKAIEDISYACSNLFTSDLVTVAHNVLKPFCELTGTDYGVVLLLKKPEEQIYIVASYGFPEKFEETYNNKLKFTLHSKDVSESWPSLRSIFKKQIILIKNTETMNVGYSRFFRQSIGKNKISSIASVPIVVNNHSVGAITLYFKKQHEFDDEELSFIKATTNIITGTIERNHLLEAAKKSELELKQANEVLKQVNQELDSFVYIASHDLREPLRTIESFVSILQAKLSNNNDKEQSGYFNRIVNATQRMRRLIQDLTNLARASRDNKDKEYEEIDLNNILTEIQFELTAFIQSKNAEIILPDRLPKVMGDREKISSVLKNLIANGIKFNKSKTPRVCVSLSEDANFDPGKVCICVEDNGIGIEKDYQEKIFGLFQRLHSQDEYEGTGAGLAIVKKILEKYGCAIWVESEKGKGSKFYFTLPRMQLRKYSDHG